MGNWNSHQNLKIALFFVCTYKLHLHTQTHKQALNENLRSKFIGQKIILLIKDYTINKRHNTNCGWPVLAPNQANRNPRNVYGKYKVKTRRRKPHNKAKSTDLGKIHPLQ